MQTFQRAPILKLDRRQTFDRLYYPESIYYINKIAISNENNCLAREHLITLIKIIWGEVSALALYFKKGIYMDQI